MPRILSGVRPCVFYSTCVGRSPRSLSVEKKSRRYANNTRFLERLSLRALPPLLPPSSTHMYFACHFVIAYFCTQETRSRRFEIERATARITMMILRRIAKDIRADCKYVTMSGSKGGIIVIHNTRICIFKGN